APGGIADQRREIADEEHDVVTEILQLPQLVELHRVPEVKVGPRRVEAFLDRERLSARELGPQFAFDDQLVGGAAKHRDVMIDVEGHRTTAPSRRTPTGPAARG